MTALILFALLTQEVREQEPNDDQAKVSQTIAPGATFVGRLEGHKGTDTDHVYLECVADTVCAVTLAVPEGQEAYVKLGQFICRWRAELGVLKLARYRFPKGRHLIFIQAEKSRIDPPGDYRLTVTPITPPAGLEIEPNDRDNDPQPLESGRPMRGDISPSPWGDLDYFAFTAPEDGVYRLVVRRLNQATKPPLHVSVAVRALQGHRLLYRYYCDDIAEEFQFYPLFDAGTHLLEVNPTSAPRGTEYEILVSPHGAVVTDEDRKAAGAAIDRGVAWLLTGKPEENLKPHADGVESLVLAALSEGRGAKERSETVDRTYVAWLEKRFKKEPEVTWKERELFTLSRETYDNAIAALGLAEAAAAGNPRARELCAKLVDWLLAAQVTAHRPAKWRGPFAADHRAHGGWRYAADTDEADISAVGWCLVALTAASSAGIEAEGMRDAIAWAVQCALRHVCADGFAYEPGTGESGSVRNSIGALICLLYGEHPPALDTAVRDLERNLFAATQVRDSNAYPLYYAYYGTRACFLLGGRSWERWRSVMIRQLLRLQSPDGSWTGCRSERELNPRYATSLAVMMLRMCLNEVPKYLRVEARGF